MKRKNSITMMMENRKTAEAEKIWCPKVLFCYAREIFCLFEKQTFHFFFSSSDPFCTQMIDVKFKAERTRSFQHFFLLNSPIKFQFYQTEKYASLSKRSLVNRNFLSNFTFFLVPCQAMNLNGIFYRFRAQTSE